MPSKVYVRGSWRSDAKHFAKCGNTRYYHRYVCSSDKNSSHFCKYKKPTAITSNKNGEKK